MKRILLVVAMLIVTLHSGSAQTPVTPPSFGKIPLASEGTLDTYAYSIVHDVDIDMSAPSAPKQFHTNLNYFGRIADPKALKALPATINPTVALANMRDTVSYAVTYNGKVKGKTFWVFSGGAQTKPFLIKSGWILPTFKVAPMRSDWIPWPTKPGLVGAYMDFYDDAGNFIERYYFSQDGRADFDAGILYFGSEHVNRIGEMYLTYRDPSSGQESTDAFDLRTGLLIHQTSLTADSATVDFQGLVTLPDNSSSISFKAVDGAPKLYYVEYTQGTTVKIGYEAPVGTDIHVFFIQPELLASDPAGWSEVTPNTYYIPSGNRYFFRADWGPSNTTLIPYPESPTTPTMVGGK